MNRNRFRDFYLIVILIPVIWLSGCDFSSEDPTQEQPALTDEAEMNIPKTILLPTPLPDGEVSLEEALKLRRSVRGYSDEGLTTRELGQLLWAAQGITHPGGYRTAPSAGALYPLEVYLVLHTGVYHYDPREHLLQLHLEGDYHQALFGAALEQEAVLDAPAVFVITAVYERIEVKYGIERGPRYVHIEVGHASQNLLLQAATLKLGAVPIGAFYDDQVKDVLNLPDDHEPLYLIPVGYPR
jgi:SagB-type dehydrogenase family enzyme